MQHKKLHTVALIAVALALALGGWYVYANTVGRPMLEGELEHDFGIVWLDDDEGDGVSVTHTFHLVNNTDDIIFIKDIKSSCKCTIPEMDDRRVTPGTTLDLTAELTLHDSGTQRSAISLLLGDDRVQQLHVQATGRRKMPLTYIGRHIELLYNLPKNMGIRCEVYNEQDEPPPLMVRPANGVTANFKRWKLVEFYDEKWDNPAIWEAELIVTRTTPEELPKDATIDASLDGEQWLEVPINRPDLVEVIEYHEPPGGSHGDH